MLKTQFPKIKLIENKENIGFAKANNQAIKLSDAEYILLLNPDTILQEDTLQKSIDRIEKDNKIGALGIKMYDGNGKFLPESKRGFPSPVAAFSKMTGLANLFPKSKVFGKYHLGYLDSNRNHEVDVLSGAFMLIRKSVLYEIGLLDETYFMYGEDIDLSYRIQQAGYKNFYLAESNIIHFKGESTKKGNLNYIKLFYGAMIIFASKQLNKTQANFLIPILKAGIYFRAFTDISTLIVRKVFYPAMDIFVILLNIFFLKYLFEQHIKYNEHLIYPPTFLYINIPVYVSLWILSLWLFGVYTKYAQWKHIIIGLFIGFIGISVIYSFLPLSLRSSRSIIVLAFLLNNFGLLFYRWWCTKIFRLEHNFFKTNYRYIIICLPEEIHHLKILIEGTHPNSHFSGYISMVENTQGTKLNLGKTTQINEIIKAYNIAQVFFSTDTVSMKDIVQTMQFVHEPVLFKMIINQQMIISSNNKNIQGEIVGIGIPVSNRNSIIQKIRNWLS